MELLDYAKKYRLPEGFLNLSIHLEQDDWTPHSWYTHKGKNKEDNDPLNNRVVDADVREHFYPVFWDMISRYEEECSGFDLVSHMSGVRLNYYPEGTSMRKHADLIYSIFEDVPVERRGLPLLSIVGEISTDAYTGGEFYLCGQDMQLTPGDVIIFPSTFMYTHEVKPVKTGTRTSFVTWAW